MAVFLRGGGEAPAKDKGAGSPDVAREVLTNLEQIEAQVTPARPGAHRVRLDYVVYYYDPLWRVMWGRCGDTGGYLSLGGKDFSLRAGQKVRIEGLIRPARERVVEEAVVTVLEEAVPLETLPTKGRVADTARFDKRIVTLEGLVDRQSMTEPGHLQFGVVAEGRLIAGTLLLGENAPIPQLTGKLVSVRGVYVARPESATSAIAEVWVARNEDIRITGSLERDERFNLAETPIARLADAPPGEWVHVSGTLAAVREESSIRIDEGAAQVVVPTPQSTTLREGARVEAVGFPVHGEGGWTLQQAVFREAPELITNLEQLWHQSETERPKWHRMRVELVVYYYDPAWKIFWAGSADGDNYVTFAGVLPIKSGQRILIDCAAAIRNGLVIDDPKITVLEERARIEPMATNGRIGDMRRLDRRFVVAEGYVDRQVVNDPRHLQLDLVIEGRPVTGRLLLDEGAAMPKWDGALVRLRGVYAATIDPTGAPPAIELWCAGPGCAEVKGTIDQDPRFELPPTPIEKITTLSGGTMVHVVGAVRAQQPGKSLTLRDETGQVTLHTAQARAVALGDAVEAIGVVTQDSTELSLSGGLFRNSKAAPPPPAAGLPKLRLADQLRELLPEEAARGYPVQLSGIVTWARPEADFFFVRDVSGGVCVYRPPTMTMRLYTGSRVDLTGVSASGKFTPVVLAAHVDLRSTLEPPEARPVTLEQALTGIEEAQWVRMSGYVRAVTREGPWARIELATAAGEFSAMLAPNDRWAKLVGAVIRVRGVCAAVANNKRQLTGIQMWVPGPRHVEIEEAAPADPYSVAARPLASLRQYGSLDLLNRRIRVSGVVVHQAPGRLVHLQDGNESLLVLSRDPTPLTPGDRIEAVGFPGRQNNRLVLREAVFRRMSAGAQPPPVRLEKLDAVDPELDGRLVHVEGALLQVSAHDKGVELAIQRERVIFSASLGLENQAVPAGWAANSRVALTGVYDVQFDEYRRPHDARILLRSPADVVVLRRAPWWTTRRVLAVTGVLAVGLVLGFGWVIALRRRVGKQTELIREQIEKEKAARLEAALARASKLESLGVLAGGIAHDFNNLLTVVIGNVSLGKLDPGLSPETQRCLVESERAAVRAAGLTQQLLTFAKGGEPMRLSTRLPEVVREAAQFALHGSKIGCDFHFAPDLWPADVDRGQIGQVVHNLVLNAAQAMPAGGLIRIGMRNDEVTAPRQGLAAGRYVKTTFADSGSGISADNLPRIFEPYFTTKQQGSGLGLATVYSIVKKHQGHVEVTSTPGVGTTFHLWLPAAASAPAPEAPPVHALPVKTGRVLFMDDEPAIRLVGAAVLKRQGFEVTAVIDGAEVVRKYRVAVAEQRPFDLVILDLTVPGGMGGAEAMEQLRVLDPGVRAIVSSGYSSDPVMANYQAHGFVGRVPKPYQASDLLRAVDAVLRER